MAAVGSCVGPSPALCGSYFGFGHFAGLNIAGFWAWRGTAACAKTQLFPRSKGPTQPWIMASAYPPKAQSQDHDAKTPIMHRLEAHDFMEQLLPQEFGCLNQCLDILGSVSRINYRLMTSINNWIQLEQAQSLLFFCCQNRGWWQWWLQRQQCLTHLTKSLSWKKTSGGRVSALGHFAHRCFAPGCSAWFASREQPVQHGLDCSL